MNFATVQGAALALTAEPSGYRVSGGPFGKIDSEWTRQLDSFRSTATFGGDALDAELSRIQRECASADWDGYGAQPVTKGALDAAKRFHRTMPFSSHAPTVGVDPDGHISFEWYSSPRRVLSVSISPDGLLNYAARLGATDQYGTMPFSGQFPVSLHEIIGLVARQ